MTVFGPTFGAELAAAGLIGLPFSWSTDGSVCFGPTINDADKAKIEAVIAAHDPNKMSPALLHSYAATKKSSIEQGGITINGVAVATDRGSQAMITQTVLGLMLVPNVEINWKNPDGSFTMLSAAELQGIACIVVQYVAQTFNVLSQVQSLIDAGTLTTTDQIDAYFAQHITTSFTTPSASQPSS
jgi:hypothetical protein